MNSKSVFVGGDVKEESELKALWISRENKTMKLMARMANDTLVGLEVPLCEQFKARVLRVDATMCRICVYPLTATNCRKKLITALRTIGNTNEEHLRPFEITAGFVYLVRSGTPFRAVITNQESAQRYMVFDVDSGMAMLVEIKDIFKLPATLCETPPLVMCIAVPPSAVVATSPDYISEDSIVECKIVSEDLVLCVEGAYPPVLVCEVRADKTLANEGYDSDLGDVGSAESCSNQSLRGGSPGFRATLARKSTSAPESSSNAGGREGVDYHVTRLLTVKQSVFKPYHVVLPYRVMACVSERVMGDLYHMRDTTLLATIYEHVIHPLRNLTMDELVGHEGSVGCIARVSRLAKIDAQRANRCRLYRGTITGVDPTQGTCSVFLVDYGQRVNCGVSAVFDLSDQPYEVRRLPSASFTVRVRGSGTGRRNRSRTVTLLDEEEYAVQLTAQDDDGCYLGTVSIPITTSSGSRRGRRGRGSKRHAQLAGTETAGAPAPEDESKETVEQQQEEVRKEQQAIADATNALRRERELFEAAKVKREQDMALMMMQLQIANISRKLDAIATGTLRNVAFGVGGYPALGSALQLNNNAYVPPHQPGLQQPIHHATRDWLGQNNEQLAMMQRMLLAQQGGAVPGSYAPLPSHPNVANAAANVLSSPTANSLGSTHPSFPVPTSTVINEHSSVAPLQDTSASRTGSAATLQQREAHIGGPISSESRSSWKGDQSIPSFSAVSAIGSPSYGRNSARALAKGPSLASNKSLEYEPPSSARVDRSWALGSHGRYQTEYGEPPKHLLSEYEPTSFKKNTNDDCSPHKIQLRSLAGQPSCTICQGEGHFAKSCPSDFAAQAAGDHPDIDSGFKIQAQKPTKFEKNAQKAKMEVLYVMRPRDRDGRVLYTSDESSGEDSQVDLQSDIEGKKNVEDHQTEKPVCENLSAIDAHISTVLDGGCDAPTIFDTTIHSISQLKYKPYVKHIEVDDGCEYVVKRSDDDHDSTMWPLFFVQIQNDEQVNFIEEHLDSLDPQHDLPDDQVVVGTLCASYCAAFEAMFRAVITGIAEDGRVEVHYIDYGNYEVVDRKQLKLLDDQPELTRTFAAMAIPCVLSAMEKVNTKAGDGMREDGEVTAVQEQVSCDLDHFTLRFLKRRPDGVNIVEVVRDAELSAGNDSQQRESE